MTKAKRASSPCWAKADEVAKAASTARTAKVFLNTPGMSTLVGFVTVLIGRTAGRERFFA